ncbi:unnamed protein product, partial [Laminaria digitata]
STPLFCCTGLLGSRLFPRPSRNQNVRSLASEVTGILHFHSIRAHPQKAAAAAVAPCKWLVLVVLLCRLSPPTYILLSVVRYSSRGSSTLLGKAGGESQKQAQDRTSNWQDGEHVRDQKRQWRRRGCCTK